MVQQVRGNVFSSKLGKWLGPAEVLIGKFFNLLQTVSGEKSITERRLSVNGIFHCAHIPLSFVRGSSGHRGKMLIFLFFLVFFSRSRFRFLKFKTKNEIFTFVSRFQFQKSKTRNDKCKINRTPRSHDAGLRRLGAASFSRCHIFR